MAWGLRGLNLNPLIWFIIALRHKELYDVLLCFLYPVVSVFYLSGCFVSEDNEIPAVLQPQ